MRLFIDICMLNCAMGIFCFFINSLTMYNANLRDDLYSVQ